jgi:hypothetical protein
MTLILTRHQNDSGIEGDEVEYRRRLGRSIVVRATEEIWANQPLQVLFPRCFSLGYTLFRYGFLPLRHRDVDRRASALDFDVPHMLPPSDSPDEFGTDGCHPTRFFEQRLDGKPLQKQIAERSSGVAAKMEQLPEQASN